MGKHNGKRYHFLYRTTNLVNNKYYYGVHSTYNLKDGYLGSGKRLTRAVKKYGKENFKCEILEFFESREEVLKRENEIVNEQLINDPLCMNLKPGGNGGFSKESSKKGTNTMLTKIWSDAEFINRNKKRLSKQSKALHLEGTIKGNIHKIYNWNGKKHKKESKIKMSESHTGEKNSQFGTCWIHNSIYKQNKKIKKEDLNFWLNQKWEKGRKIKF